MKLIVLIHTLLITSSAISQVRLSDYSESINTIKLELELESSSLLTNQSAIEETLLDGFYDLSKPGEYALPSKEVFVAIPEQAKIVVNANIIQSNKFSLNLGFNPKAVSLNDSTTTYSFKALEYKPFKIKPTIEVLGFLWIKNIYCTHLRINQYQFNDVDKIVNEINKVDVKIISSKSISNPQNYSEELSDYKGKKYPSIINSSYAEKFIYHKVISTKEDSTYNWIDFNSEYLKIGTALDGIYNLDKTDLENQNLSINSIDPRTFKLFLKGEEIPIFVQGQEDGIFDDTDFIEFFGIRNMGGNHRELSEYNEPYNEYLDRYTDTTIYWLTWGSGFGQRVKVNDSYNSVEDTLKYYNEKIHLESNAWFDFSSADLIRREKPFWTENKTWGWGFFNGGTVRTYRFNTSDVFPDKQTKLFAKMQSYATQLATNAHLLSLSLNTSDLLIDTTAIDKYEKIVLQANVNSNELIEGSNSLKAHSFLTSSSINICFFDWAEMEYPRYLKTYNDSLIFQFPDLNQSVERVLKIINATKDNYSLWKKGDHYEKYLIETTNNSIFFSDTISNSDKFVLIEKSRVKKPKIYYTKNFQDIRNSSNQADYIAITHKKFLQKTDEYINLIADKYNVTTKIIDIDDIYDEFSYGFFNPEVIRDFLQLTHCNWQTPLPKYVILIGDATYDYHHNKEKYLGLPRVSNYVPSFGAPVSDTWFVIWDSTGANIPQMNIGRLPVKEVDQLERYLERHKTYVEQGFDDWNKKYLFFSGGKGDNQSELTLLSNTNNFIIDEFVKPTPIGGDVNHFYKTVNPVSNFGPFESNFVQAAVDNGGVFISYIGHSGTRTWDNSITEPEHLNNNRNRFPLVTDYGCSTAKFAESDITSYSELFVLSENSQGIAYIGNSSLGFTGTATYFPKIFYKKILADSVFNISEALNLAKLEMLQTNSSSGSYQLFTLTNTLIGDPIVNLPIPLKPNLNVKSENILIKENQLNDAVDSLHIRVIYDNFGSVNNDSLIINIKDEYGEQVSFENDILRKIPSMSDTLNFSVPIKNKPGKHILRISLDVKNKIEEISEEDNSIVFEIIIASSSTRSTLSYGIENAIDSTLTVLNPSTKPNIENLIFEVSDSSNFFQPLTKNISLDTFSTKISLKELESSKRYWIRTKLDGENNYGETKSFYWNEDSKYIITDSLSFLTNDIENLIWDNEIKLGVDDIKLSVFSAGFLDGNTALIQRKETNYIPESTIAGHHVSLFEDRPPYEFVSYNYFNTFSGGSTVWNQYKDFLDSLTNDHLILIAVSDDGRISDHDLRERLKALGSKYIDSLKFRSSWALIGKKGAVQGSVPEAFSHSMEGPVTIDTSFQQQFTNGTLTSSVIGPADNWIELTIEQNIFNGTSISYYPIGINVNGEQDTLNEIGIVDNKGDLSFVDDDKYRYIKLQVYFNTNSFDKSPTLNSIGANYIEISELGINYQVVSVEKDTLEQGEDANLSFYVYNVGESTADSFKVSVDVVKPDNSKERIFQQLVDSLGSEQRKKFEIA